MRKSVKIAIFVPLGLLVGLLLIGFFLYQATQQEPEFYTQALEIEPEVAAEAGEILEEQVFALSNQIKKPTRWQLSLTDAQINGWLASDLEEKFPKFLPKEVEKPRVLITEDQILLACRFKGQQFQSVMTLSVDIFLVEEEENVVAIRIHQATAGLLPVPLSQLLDQIAEHTDKAEVPVRWKQIENDPVALLHVPSTGEGINGRIRIDTIALRDGEIYLAGETVKAKSVSETREEAEVAAAQ
ncbi:MAG: hypothetical protein COA78_10795 [Blastopirellula sp.]|nr:MAG: hypothetical protein COA78_10795 [Blastopirellula sp.]